jgi:hypothetical protein
MKNTEEKEVPSNLKKTLKEGKTMKRERRKTAMFQRSLSIMALLIMAMLVLGGCGSSGSGSLSESSNQAKTAKVSLSFNFPDGEVGSALISDATTHILVTVTQWSTDGLNNLQVVNTDKVLLTKSSPSTTIDLFPTYTRICASQYKGDPNNSETSLRLETACTFGKLQPGNNSVTLTMMRGTWTLGQAFNNISAIALARVPDVNSEYSYSIPVFDGDPSFYSGGPFTSGISCYNNWGCLYQTMFKEDSTRAWQFLRPQYGGSGAGYSNTFNAPYLLIGGVEEQEVEVIGDNIGDDDGICEPGEICDRKLKSGFAIGGVSGTVDTSGYTEQKDMINFIRVPAENYSYYYTKPVLETHKVTMKIEQKSGSSYTDVTSTIVNPCKLNITGGTSITGCGIKHTDFVPGTQANHNYRITFTHVASGPTICYMKDSGAEKDASGNIICYDYDYSRSPVYACNDGTWNNSTQRCEETLAEACSDLGGTLSGQTCTTSNNTYTGSSICYNQPNYYSYPIWGSDGTVTGCYNFSSYFSGYSYTCWHGGTYNSQKERCERSAQTACTSDGGTYDSSTQTCTETDVSYALTINTPTSIILTGTGSLPSAMTTTTQ